MTAEEVAVYRETERRRRIQRAERIESRRLLALTVARDAARFLSERFSCARVLVIGSCARPEHFHERSDIDLLVWGLSDEDYYRAVGFLQEIHPDFAVDVVRAEVLASERREAFEKEGVEP